MADSYEDILNSLNEAMSIHAQKAIENLPFNKSELVEIVNDTMAEQNTYVVWNGSVRYEVFSTTEIKYNIGDKVYVTIPNGDFSQKKYIIGPYVDNNGENLLYQSPFAGYEGTGENIFNGDANIYQIVISRNDNDGNEDNEINLNETIMFQEDEDDSDIKNRRINFGEEGIVEKLIYELTDANKYNKGYRYLAISADIMTDFSHRFSFGDYGLKVEITYSLKLETIKDTEDFIKTYYLDTNDMLGDLYNFSTYFNQKKLIQLEKDNPIVNIKVYLFAKNNFIPVNWNEEDSSFNCINFKNIKLEFGDPEAKVEERVYLYTLDGETYDSRQANSANKKTLYVKWDHYNDITGISYHYDNDNKNSNIEIHWYQEAVHSLGEQIENKAVNTVSLDVYNDWNENKEDQNKINALIDTYGLEKGKHYTINEDDNTFIMHEQAIITAITNLVKSLENEENKISDTLAGSGWKAITTDTKKWKLTISPDITKNSDKYLVIIKDGDNIYRSNEYEFKNLVQVSDPATVAKLAGLKIICRDGKNGNYPIYSGNTGEILSKSEIIDRELSLELNDPIDNKTYLNGNETIIWKIPKKKSMIQMNSSFYTEDELKDENQIITFLDTFILNDEDKNKILNEKEKYYYIVRSRTKYPESNDANDKNKSFISQKYRVENFYNKLRINNTIFCYVVKNNTLYEASKEFIFSQYGTSGSEYTFQVYLGDIVDSNGKITSSPEPILTIGETNYHKINAVLLDNTGEIVKENDDITITWYYNPGGFSVDNENKITKIKANNNITKCYKGILKASVKHGNINFTQLLPLPVRSDKQYGYYEGPDKITYDDTGSNPSQYNQELKMSGKEGLVFSFNESKENILNKLGTFISENKIIPSLVYYSDIISKNALTIIAKDKDNIVFTCPLLILQNKYQIPIINQWDTSLKIDEKRNAILSSMMIAGTKDNNNQFTGVIMGGLAKDGSTTISETGLFGYQEGKRVFDLNTTGKFTLGASGRGQIEFNGTKGTIKGGNKDGLEIDLGNGTIKSNKKIEIDGADGSNIHFGDNKNYIEMGLNSTGPFLKGYWTEDNKESGDVIFQLSKNTNKIGGWIITKDSLYNDENGIYINGTNGTISAKTKTSQWSINQDGTASFDKVYVSNGIISGGTISAKNVGVTAGVNTYPSLEKYINLQVENLDVTKLLSANGVFIKDKNDASNKVGDYIWLPPDKDGSLRIKATEFRTSSKGKFYISHNANDPGDTGDSTHFMQKTLQQIGSHFDFTWYSGNGWHNYVNKSLYDYVMDAIQVYINTHPGSGLDGGFSDVGIGDNEGKKLGASNWKTTPGNGYMSSMYPDYPGPWKNCTWSVWEIIYTINNGKVKLPIWGNAINWYEGARNTGGIYSVGSTPKPGSILVLSSDSGFGHVAVITKVYEDGKVDSMEGNYGPDGARAGWREAIHKGVLEERSSDKKVVGYIYITLPEEGN